MEYKFYFDKGSVMQSDCAVQKFEKYHENGERTINTLYVHEGHILFHCRSYTVGLNSQYGYYSHPSLGGVADGNPDCQTYFESTPRKFRASDWVGEGFVEAA